MERCTEHEESTVKHELEVADRILAEALDLLRMLTPEGWQEAYFEAMSLGWHTGDLSRLQDARLLSMRATGQRYKCQIPIR